MLHLQCHAPELYAGFTDDSDDTEFWTNITKAQILETKDAGLSSYLDHLQALASSMTELEKEQPDINALRKAIAVWLRICEECENGQHPKTRVDNIPDLLCHLRGIADFCHIKGHMKLRVIVLKLVARLNEASEYSSSVDETVISYSNLASQYLELGYSGKAGLAFDKAQSYAQQANVGVLARLRLQLSYSEYLLVIGDVETWYVSVNILLLSYANINPASKPYSRRMPWPCQKDKKLGCRINPPRNYWQGIFGAVWSPTLIFALRYLLFSVDPSR